MTPEERQLLTALADRIKSAPSQQHDSEADSLLNQLARERPDTAYLLAQTVLMQELAMRNAQAQIADLQRQIQAGQQPAPQRSSGGFLAGLFGGGNQPASSVPPVNPWAAAQTAPTPSAYPPAGYVGGYAPVIMQPSQTSGFLRQAATTAAGIAGGALLFEGIESLFSGHQGYGGFMNPGGFGGGDWGPRESLSETTINNYYEDAPSAGGQQPTSYETGTALDQGGGYQDVNDTGNFDTGGDFGGSDFGGGDFGGDDFST